MTSSKPISVTLGEDQASVDRRLASGQYGSASEVVRAGLRALDREEEILGQIMGDKVRAAFASEGPDVAAEDVFARLRAHHAEQLKAKP
ncbi:type II toxin-antitoxin system ParD family antitoxin [Tardiphaga sp.]|jgi:antitoxin ParD1/3/4|uniref:type II toxin-antitoxin system ParD family antitoxin n=1 Tax=Tardiphaga sp. TaxID=1926292 RepID=UPI0037D99F23